MTRKVSYLPCSFIILFAAVFSMLLNSCTQTSYTYGIVGTPAISANGQYVTLLVAEIKSITRQVNGGYRSTDYNTDYWLKLYETATGKLIKKKKIITAAEDKNMLPLCYGGYGDKIWLHSNELKAYNISSLEETVNEGKLATGNGFDKNNFPYDSRFLDAFVSDGYINFISPNGDKYRIDLDDLKIRSQKTAVKNPQESINQQLHLLNTDHVTYGVRCDTLNGSMYMLAKDSAAAMGIYPGNSDEERVYKKLHLFTANFSTDNVGNHRFYRYSNMQRMAGASYLNGVFLKDFTSNKIVRLQKPAAYVIMHNDSLSNNARSMLTAIDKSNNTIWQLNTGICTKIANCTVKKNYCIIIGNKHSLIAPHIGSDMLCLVNLETGKMVLPQITE
jgi:hypothetical protein